MIMEIDYYQGIVSGDDKIEKYIYQKFKKPVMVYIQQRGADKEVAEDIYHKAFIAIWQKVKSGNRPSLDFEKFFYLVVLSKWIDHTRSKAYKAGKRSEKDLFEEELNGMAIADEDRRLIDDIRFQELVRNTLSELSTTCIKIIKRALGGMSDQAIATELDLSISYVYKRKSECAKALRQKVEGSVIYEALKFEFHG